MDGEKQRRKGHSAAGNGSYLSCLAIHQLPFLGSVEFYVTLRFRQFKTRLTDSQTARIGPIEVLKRMGRMEVKPALERAFNLAYCIPRGHILLRNCLHLSKLSWSSRDVAATTVMHLGGSNARSAPSRAATPIIGNDSGTQKILAPHIRTASEAFGVLSVWSNVLSEGTSMLPYTARVKTTSVAGHI